MKNFGEFFNNQIESAQTIILSRTQEVKEDKLEQCVKELREHNTNATVITTPWEEISGTQILTAMEQQVSFVRELMKDEDICPQCGKVHAAEEQDHQGHSHREHEHSHESCDHDHNEHCHESGHTHDHDEHCHESGHSHDHDEHCHAHEDEEQSHKSSCGCGHDHHDHHGHHHADEVFSSWGTETPHKYDKQELTNVLETLSETDRYGMILRAKGIVPCTDGSWMYFDLVPGEYEIRSGAAEVTGRLCVIGSKLNETAIAELFKVS